MSAHIQIRINGHIGWGIAILTVESHRWCSSTRTGNRCDTGQDAIFIKGHTTNSHFIKGYILSSANRNCMTCIRNSNIIAIDEVNRITTNYCCSTIAIGLDVPRCRRFSQILNMRIPRSR